MTDIVPNLPAVIPPNALVIAGVRLLIKFSPFTDARREHQAPWGYTLTELIDIYASDLPPEFIVISIDDYPPVHPRLWDHVTPKAGHQVFIRLAPQGGQSGGQIAFQIGIVLAAAAAAYFTAGLLGPPVAGSLVAGSGLLSAGGAAAVGGLVGAAVTVGGTFAAMSLFPPPKTEEVDNRASYSITGTSNEIAQVGQVIPYVAGRYQVYPLHVAEPYVTMEDGEQYLHMLLSPGFGPLNWIEIKIGDVPIDEIEDLEYETREGRPTDTRTNLYPKTFFESAPPPAVIMQGNPAVAHMGHNVDQLYFEITFPEGLYSIQQRDGKIVTMDAYVRIEYGPSSTGPWTVLFTSDLAAQTNAISANSQAVLRRKWQTTVPLGDYFGRVSRLHPDDETQSSSNRIHSKFIWSSFRGRVSTDPVQRTDIALLAIKVKAGPETSGMIDQISADVRRYALMWDGAAWVEGETTYPADLFRDVLQYGPANRNEIIDDEDIDLVALQEWRATCDAKNYRFGAVFSDETTLLERLRQLASAGRATYSMNQEGQHSVIEDKERAEIVQAITPHNAANISLERTYARVPHAIKVRFVDRDADWTVQEMVVFNDERTTANSSIYDDLDLTRSGIFLRKHAHDEGRYWLAVQTHRRFVASATMDFEHIAARRGERVTFAANALLYGLETGRVQGISGNTVILEGAVTMNAGRSYGLTIRTVTNAGTHISTTVPVATNPGTTRQISANLPTSAQIGDLYQFGEAGLEVLDAIIKSITPSGGRTAQVTIVAYKQPEINNSDTAPIGDYDPGITIPPGLRKPPATPRLLHVRWDDLTLRRERTGVGRRVHAAAVLAQPPAKRVAPEIYRLAFRVLADEGEPNKPWHARDHAVTGLDVEFIVPWGRFYEVRVKALATVGGRLKASGWSNIKILDAITLPDTWIRIPPPTGLELMSGGNRVDFNGRDAHFAWRPTGVTGAAEIGEEAGNADISFRDATFSHWWVEIYTGEFSSTELRRQSQRAHPTYHYTYEKNYADAKKISETSPKTQVARKFTIRVYCVDNFGYKSDPAVLTVENEAPRLPDNVSVSVNIGSIGISFDEPSDPDFVGMMVWASTASLFQPQASNLLGKVKGNHAVFNEFQHNHQALGEGVTYFLRIAGYDEFTSNLSGVGLDISQEFEAITGTVVITSDNMEYDFERGGSGWDLIDQGSPINATVTIGPNTIITGIEGSQYGPNLLRIFNGSAFDPLVADNDAYMCTAETYVPCRRGQIWLFGFWSMSDGGTKQVMRVRIYDALKAQFDILYPIDGAVLGPFHSTEMDFHWARIQIPTLFMPGRFRYNASYFRIDLGIRQTNPAGFGTGVTTMFDGITFERRAQLRSPSGQGEVVFEDHPATTDWHTIVELELWVGNSTECEVEVSHNTRIEVIDPISVPKTVEVRLIRTLFDNPDPSPDPSVNWVPLEPPNGEGLEVATIEADGSQRTQKLYHSLKTTVPASLLPGPEHYYIRLQGRVTSTSANQGANVRVRYNARRMKLDPEY